MSPRLQKIKVLSEILITLFPLYLYFFGRLQKEDGVSVYIDNIYTKSDPMKVVTVDNLIQPIVIPTLPVPVKLCITSLTCSLQLNNYMVYLYPNLCLMKIHMSVYSDYCQFQTNMISLKFIHIWCKMDKCKHLSSINSFSLIRLAPVWIDDYLQVQQVQYCIAFTYLIAWRASTSVFKGLRI